MAELKSGSIEAFNQLYDLYGSRLLSYVSKATRTNEDAVDIVHDIFIYVWRNRCNLDVGSDIATLLFSLAYRRRIDYFRHLNATPVFADFTELHDQDGLADSTDSQSLEYRDFIAIVDKALDRLPRRRRDIVRLSRIDGLTNAEIASRLAIAEKTVRNEISLGLKTLKSELTRLQYNLK